MANDGQYTSIDFLSKIRLQPKKHLFRHLSVDVDLEQINQVLSPRNQIQPNPQTEQIDKEMTRRFMLQILKRYQNQDEVNRKWQAFVESTKCQKKFEAFFKSLKDITNEQNQAIAVDPEKSQQKNEFIDNKSNIKVRRSHSTKKSTQHQVEQPVKKAALNDRQKIKNEINSVKELLLAGEKFIRQNQR